MLLLLYSGNITNDEYNKNHIKFKNIYATFHQVVHLFVLHIIFYCHMIVLDKNSVTPWCRPVISVRFKWCCFLPKICNVKKKAIIFISVTNINN